MELNSQQKMAVEHIEGPALVLAGAGSGKTRVVTCRIAHLLQMGVPAAEILAVTFTNKAAAEMRHRVEKQSHRFVLTCTFHSLCARILREAINFLGFPHDFAIYDEDDSEKLLKHCFTALNIKDEKGLLRSAKSIISSAKNDLVSPEELKKEDPITGEVYDLYQRKLKEYQAVDFDDLLFLTVQLFREHPSTLESFQKRWSFILIDEYQDTNKAQHEIVKALSKKHGNVFAVGDPDQSIYSWRGASIGNILNFERDFPGARVIALEQNYRSRTTILNAANALIAHNESRYKKHLWSDRGPGEKICLYLCENEHAEADFVLRQIALHQKTVSLNDCVVFYRTNFQSRVMEDALLKARIPYVIIGGLSFYQRREIKDILSLLRIVLGGADFLAFARTVNIPKRGLGETAVAKVREAAEQNQTTILDACSLAHLPPKQTKELRNYVDMVLALREMVKARVPLATLLSSAIERSRYIDYLKEDPESFEERRENLAELISKAAEWEADHGEPSLAGFLEELALRSSADEKPVADEAVRLMTLHNGKGLEFDIVFLVGMEEDLFPHINTKDSPDAIQEERRLAYVGMTRAKERLYLSACKTRFLWGTPRIMRPSRFLAEIPSEYLQTKQKEPHFQSDEALEEGDTVHHRDFGTGVIRRSYQSSLGLTYDVFFPEMAVTRSLVAKYAKLKSQLQDFPPPKNR